MRSVVRVTLELVRRSDEGRTSSGSGAFRIS
jgi:hypothetical protein